MIELVEKGGPRLLDLVKIEGGVIVGVQFLYRTRASRLAEGRQAAGGKHGTDNQDIQHCCASQVDAGDISARSVETLDEANPDWVGGLHKNDRDRLGRRFCCKRALCAFQCNDHGYLTAN